MKPSTALAWKEWHEVRIYLWIGLFVFLGLPAIAGLEEVIFTSHRFSLDVSRFVIIFGGVLTVFIAVGATCRDLQGRLEDFWRSRPVGVARWILTKYFIGMAVALAACLIPVAVENWVDSRREVDALDTLAVFPFHWIAVYSLAFVAGCLLRRPAHAAMLGITAMLLMWFLPLVLPPIGWLNPAEVVPGMLVFFDAVMLGIAIVSILVSIVAVQRGWQIHAGVRLLYSTIAGAVLILLASAAFQLGTNLPVLQSIDLPNHKFVYSIHYINGYGSISGLDGHREEDFYNFDAKSKTIRLTRAGPTQSFAWWMVPDTTTADGTIVQYEIDADRDDPTHRLRLIVHGQTSAGVRSTEEIHNLELWNLNPRTDVYAAHYVWNDRLYVISFRQNPDMKNEWYFATTQTNRLATLDITDRLHPRLMSIEPFDFRFDQYLSDAGKFEKVLPQIPGLPNRERMNLALRYHREGVRRENDSDIICITGLNSIVEYRLAKLTDSKVEFDRVGAFEPSIIDRAFGMHSWGEMYLNNGFLYQQRSGSGPVRNTLFVYDLHGPKPMRLVAHFATPEGIHAMCPLPDGRMLIGSGSKIFVVGPPRRAE